VAEVPYEPPAELAATMDPDGAERSDPEVKKWLEDEHRAPTSTLRTWWAPWYAGKSEFTDVKFFGRGVGGVPTVAAPAYAALERALRAKGYVPQEAWAYNVRNIARSSLPSLHSYGIAVDLDSKANPYVPWSGWHQTRFTPDQIAAVDAIVTTRGVRVWKWGGHWRPDADLMHFQIDCHPDELRAGIVGQSAVRRDTTMVSEIASTKKASVQVDLPYLRKGDKGAPVRSLQALLSTRSTLEVDGSFGTNTDTAVRKLQAAAALDVDGVVGPDTWRALLEM
jgi:Putative peptidoglycan binding domain/D-alanyl-D-alanine carboxypeptidase